MGPDRSILGGPDRITMNEEDAVSAVAAAREAPKRPVERPMDRASGLLGEDGLLAAARRGDRDAAGALLSAHHQAVFRMCRFLLGRGGDAEGAAQEVMLRALRSLSRFRAAGSFRGWLAAIATHLCRDRLRRRRLIPFLSLEGGEGGGGPTAQEFVASRAANPEEEAMARQAAELVSREVAALPARQREAFALRFFGELEMEEIAAAMAVDVGTVKTHLHRAVHRVRRAVEEARP